MKKMLLLLAVYLFSGVMVIASGQSTVNPDGSHTFYVAADGNDNNDGSLASPFATLMRAHRDLIAGDTVYIRGGLYKIPADAVPATTDKSGLYADMNYFDKTGTKEKNICIWGYKNERPVFDFSNVKPANQRVTAFLVSGDYYYFKNFDVTGVQVTILTHTQSECFRNENGNYNKYEDLAMHDGQAIGFYLTNGIGNTVRNCDAYNNCDITSEGGVGGNVDGFGCHPSRESGMGNRFIGCRAWLNSDDGFDLINAYAAVTFDSCWAFYNGYSKDDQGNLVSRGDGNGFKSGGYGMPDIVTKYPNDSIPHHIVRHCIAFYNKSSGFYANHHLGGNYYLNNTAYRNGTNFNMVNRKSPEENVDVPGYGHVLINNLSFNPRSTGADLKNLDGSLSENKSNSFTVPVIVGTDDDFNSIDASQLELPRGPGGRLPDIAFLTLRTDKYIDKGQSIGFPFYGAAPDLGYHETTVPPVIVPVDLNLNPDGTHTFFVAPSGSDGQNGTIEAPFATIMFASGKMVAGDTLYIRGGLYKIAADVPAATTDGGKYFDINYFPQKGSAGSQFYIWGYKNERPVFDYSDVKPQGQGVNAFYVTGNYLYFKNIEVTGLRVDIAGENLASGFRNDRGNHNSFENLSVHDGQSNGFYITQGIGNLIHNCDAYNNYAAGAIGNGFVCRPSSTGGKDNRIIGCRAWRNGHDGFDLSFAYTSVTLDSCWAFENGFSQADGLLTTRADGNGFTTGGYGSAAVISKYPDPIPQHIIMHCLAYANGQAGFSAGHDLGGNLFYNNTAYKNNVNFDMIGRKSVSENIDVAGYGHVLKNNIAYSPVTANGDLINLDENLSTNTSNTFTPPVITITDDNFNRLDPSALTEERKAGGSLPEISFLTLKGSSLTDKGMDVGLPYLGSAPDLGYAEALPGAGLPVVYLLPLKGKVINGQALLYWTTANEMVNSGFAIQRSIDGLSGWKTMGYADPGIRVGNGFRYQFHDRTTLDPFNYYRLCQTDLDGTPHLSEVVLLKALPGNRKTAFTVYPNPVTAGRDMTLVFGRPLPSAAICALYGLNGVLLTQVQLPEGQTVYTVTLPSLQAGTYFIRVTSKRMIMGTEAIVVK